jgi:hypothetical protein
VSVEQEQCSWPASVTSGLIGAVALTALHESLRGMVAHPPRMDLLGRRAIKKSLDAAGQETKPRAEFHRWALAGDIVANTIYYASIARGVGRAKWGRALVLGTAAGVGALALPPTMGLGRAPNSQYASTQLMTMAIYLTGALASAAAASYMNPRRRLAASRS